MYFKVPIIDGVLDIDYEYMMSGISTSDTEAYVKLREGYALRPSWESVTEEEWISVQPPEPGPVEPLPTLEEIQAQTLLNTEYLVCLAEISNL